MMKKSCWLKTLFFGFVAAGLVLAGCSNPAGPAASQGTGTGRITVSIGLEGAENLPSQNTQSREARTLAPDFSGLPSPFTKFTLSFTETADGAAHAPVDINSGTTAVVDDLVVGTYTISVTGYVETDEIALGSAAGIVVTDGGNTPAPITLGPKTGAGTGTFSYDITVPEGTGTATLTITTLEAGSVEDGIVDLKTTPSGSITTLAPGYYLVDVVLTKDGKTAGLNEALHLYRGLTSSLTREYANSDFGEANLVSATNLTSLFVAPATGETPDTSFAATQYTGAIAWKIGAVPFEGAAFAASTAYTAVVTLTAKPNYTFMGIAENAFTHGDKNGTNEADGNVVTIVFDATTALPVVSATDLTALFAAPATGETPAASFNSTQYNGAIAWKVGAAPFEGSTFGASTAYTAVVTLTANSNYTFAGLGADAFTHGSKTGTNEVNGNVVTIVFDATEAAPVVSATDLTAHFTAPATGETPDASFTATQYNGSIAWKVGPDPFVGTTFGASTAYTAVVTLTANSNYTFTGIAENAFTHGGKTGANEAGGNVVTIVFDATEAAPPAFGSVNVSVGFGPQNGTITVAGSDGTNTIEQGAILNLSISDFESYVWKVDGGSEAVGTANPLVLDTSAYAVQPHTLSFIGTRGGIPYSQLIPFTVTEAGEAPTASTSEYVTYNSLVALKTSLEAAAPSSVSAPYKVKLGSELNINDIFNIDDGMEPLYENFGGQYVDLDLSGLNTASPYYSVGNVAEETPLPDHRELLVKLTLPGGFSAVGQRMFKGCANLVWVKVNDDNDPQRLATFNTQSFNGCTSLEKVYAGMNINTIGANAFSGCPVLVMLVINKSTKASPNANAFAGDVTQVTNIMVYVPDGSISAHSGTSGSTLNKAGIPLDNIKSMNDLADRPENWQ
jgi:hypothetical protein